MGAADYAEEDRLLRAKVDSRNGLEAYLYNLKNSIEGDDLARMTADSKKEILDLVDETLDWMDENPEASKEDYDDHKQEVERIAVPFMRDFYSNGGGADGDEGDFYDSDL